jgi:hypothetical protein
MNQCLQTADNMFNAPLATPTQTLKRKSVGDLVEQQPHKRIATLAPMEVISAAVPSPPLMAGAPPPHTLQLPPIQPRPVSANGLATGPLTPTQPISNTLPTAKKRGRPSRADRHKQLRPQLPQRLTPLAPLPSPPQVSVVNAISGPGRPVAIAPAPGPPKAAAEYSPSTPTTTTYSASPTATGSQTAKKRGRPPSVDKAQPASHPTEIETGSVSNRS